MTEVSELKPCPFCGGRAYLHDIDSIQGTGPAFVECGTCSVIVESSDGPPESAIAAWNRRARPSPTGEKVEAEPVAWRWKGQTGAWVYEEGNPTKRKMREYDGVCVGDLYSASTIAALVAERDEWKGMFEQCKSKHSETMKRADAAERERDEARAELALMKANWGANVQEMSERFRAVNIERMAKQVDHDAVIWCQEASARANAAESALVTANARVARLELALTKLVAAFDHARMVPARGVGGMTIEANIKNSVYHGVPAWPVEEARAALTGGENG